MYVYRKYYAFQSLEVDEGEWLALHSGCFIPKNVTPGIFSEDTKCAPELGTDKDTYA